MKVLAVHTFPGANQAVFRHYPYYGNAGADRVVGIVTSGGGCLWPDNNTIEVGKNAYIGGPNLSQRLVDTIDVCLNRGADEVIIIEYDVLFFRPLPPLPGPGVAAVLTGGPSPGYKSSRFFHCPWYMDADTGRKVVSAGRKLLAAGEYELGSPDRFFGLILDRTGIPLLENVFTRYTRNTIASPEELKEAREAYRSGVHAMHGVKTKSQLDFITAP